MIRDPSDGSVKEIGLRANDLSELSPKMPPEEITSGLPIDKLKAEEFARLEQSREWLQNYHQRSASTST